ncbi:Probable Ni/Fe-hydrogenase 2 b-type cytochrome subunit [Serratia fonticola]|uniref:Probable Ni/Fe-hydrogenase 2 b-type cytochrome subunit n=1 Tax=Serratia fonticola TaxID=47917 RepID=A0A4U9UDB5_SERFO|nr:Probable Ni/Fe-hydrogenase 2 b-type cytochrome subunit [Serratia fonticola]
MFLVIALGALLPTMHQSSMGSLMIAAGIKIHPLWQSYEMLPLFSLLTAGILGFSIVIFEGSLVQAGLRGKGPEETPLFARMTYIIDGFLLLFIVLRFGELIWRGKNGLSVASRSVCHLVLGGNAVDVGAAGDVPLETQPPQLTPAVSRCAEHGLRSFVLAAELRGCWPTTLAMATTISRRPANC